MKKVLLIFSIMIVVLALVSCGHIHLPGEELAIEQNPTCTKDGLGYIYCLECGEVAKIVVIPATGTHKVETIPAQEATCTEKGNTEGERCSLCGEILVSPQEIPVLAHTYDDKYDDTCNECGHVRDADCAHVETEVIEGKNATCTEIGYTDGEKCKKCGEIISEQEVISMLDHSYSSVVTAPTCTEQGYTTYTCDCGDCYIDSYVDKIAHSFGEWVIVKKPTVTEEGSQERTCECGEKEIQAIDKLKASEGLEFALNDDGESYSVVGIGTCTDTDIVIPSVYNGLPVTAIGEGAFIIYWPEIDQFYSLITSVIIPNSVTTIGEGAFWYCTSLTSITIPNSVSNIVNDVVNRNPFHMCTSLTNIEVDNDNPYYKSIDGNLYTKDGKTLLQYAIGKDDAIFIVPDSVTIIEDYAFYLCDTLTTVEIPNSVTSMGLATFYHCTSLESIVIPDSVTSIGANMFEGCTSLTSIVIPDSVTSIGYYAFFYCTSLTIYCEGESQPSGWHSGWNPSSRPVVWGYTGN